MKLITEKILEITPKGIKTADDQEYELDTIIFATGFNLIKAANPSKITGIEGTDWAALNGDTPAALNGVVIVSIKLRIKSLYDLTNQMYSQVSQKGFLIFFIQIW